MIVHENCFSGFVLAFFLFNIYIFHFIKQLQALNIANNSVLFYLWAEIFADSSNYEYIVFIADTDKTTYDITVQSTKMIKSYVSKEW